MLIQATHMADWKSM